MEGAMTIDERILGGAKRKRTRVRGFAPWMPRRDTLLLIEQIEGVLREDEKYLPLTLRQCFYRLVGAHDYPKTENAYERLGDKLNRARCARIIRMDAIRDDGGYYHSNPIGFLSAEDCLRTFHAPALDDFDLQRDEGQGDSLIVWCEAAGMGPQLAREADPFGVRVRSSGGFDSLTEKFNLAREIAESDRPVEVLSIGDLDVSGAHMPLALAEDVMAFLDELGGSATFTRLAVTPEQVEMLGLDTAPFHGETCQAEAIPPDVLASIVREAIKSRFDMKVYRRLLKREAHERKWLEAQR
jgi:hypothetical protein